MAKLEENSHGGSQQSLNSTTSSVPSASDNPEQIIVQKQRKELVEEGIKRWQNQGDTCSDWRLFDDYYCIIL